MAQPGDLERSSDRTRISSLFQQLDKSVGRLVKKTSSEDLQQLRFASSRLLQLLTQQGEHGQKKQQREMVFKQAGLVDILVTILQQVSDEQAWQNTINIFIELLGRCQHSKRSSILVNHGVTLVLFGLLKQVVSQEISMSEDLLVLIHCLLAKLAYKDRKFGVKARLHRSLLLTLNLVKNNTNTLRNLQPLLQVLKYYTNNSVNASYLGKHSAINIMFRVITSCGRKFVTCSKLAFENLNNMTKSKSNSARLIGMGGVPMLLAHHSEWHQSDSKNRHVSLRKAILNTLKNITNLKSGRQAFVESDGIRVLYNSAQEASDSRELENLIMLASLIMRKCCPRNRLPLDNFLSAVVFPLPHSENHTPDCYTLSEFKASMSLSSQTSTADSDHSSLDDDDDIDSDDERFCTDKIQDDNEDDHCDGLEPAVVRSMDDLRMYDRFFPEVFEFDHLNCTTDPDSGGEPSSQDLHRPPPPPCPVEVPLPEPCCPVDSDESVGTASVPLEPTVSFNIRSGTSSMTLEHSLQVRGQSIGRRQSAPTSSKSNSRSARKTKPLLRKAMSGKDKKVKKAPVPKTDDEGGTDSSSGSHMTLPCREAMEDAAEQQVAVSSSDELDDFLGEVVTHDPQVYCQMARDTHSVYRFEKVAYPDMIGAQATHDLESLYNRKFGVQRSKVFEDIDRMIHPETIYDNVVYSLDYIVGLAAATYCTENSNLINRDEFRVARQDDSFGILRFNGQFECGNLRKAIQVRDFEYDLILNPDVNTNHHHQWFYFEVSNMAAGINYRFNIVNCEKLNSQFNFGMRPVMFSVLEAMEGRGRWVRTGRDICYYRNHFVRSSQTTGGVKGKSYYTATFTVRFMHDADVCYLAYHYPYTYTTLRSHLYQWEGQVDSTVFFRNQQLTQTLSGNPVPLLTITAQPRGSHKDDIEELWSRPYIFLSSRVHPGESNSSWVMKGTVDFLMSNKPAAQQLRERFIFKIVPMLNPDGVINGNHRCSLVAEDLNRRWLKPCPRLHPTIYHTKGLLQYLSAVNKTPLVYCDYHGHSRRKNIFMYGCSPNLSWMPNDTNNPACTGNKAEDTGYRVLPRILHMSSPLFYIQNCSFVVERGKESTARVVVWRQIGVVRSYTMESSYCGCDQGKYKDLHINTRMLEEMGHKFCEALVRLAKSRAAGFDQQLPDFGSSNVDFGGLEGLEEGVRKAQGGLSLYDDQDLGSFSDDEGSGDDEENYDEDLSN